MSKHNTITNNIAKKLELKMNGESLSVLSLSKLLDVDKHALYRVFKREFMPSMSLLEKIANYLGCTESEVIDERMFLDIDVYASYEDYELKDKKNYRIYFLENDVSRLVSINLFGIKTQSCIQVVYLVDSIITDGYYLVPSNSSELTKINVVGVGADVVFVSQQNQDVKIPKSEIKPFASLYKEISITHNRDFAVEL